MLGKIRKLDVLASLLPIFVKVPVEVWSVFVAGFALLAAVLMPTGDKLPLVVSGNAGDK